MEKSETSLNNGQELNPNEKEVTTNVEKPEVQFTPEEQIKNIESEVGIRQQEITRLTESIEGTKSKLNEAREGLGLPPSEEDPHSVLSDKEKLEKLKNEQGDLEKQKEEIVSKQEKEKLIKQEKEKILQEKLDQLFKEFDDLQKVGKFEGILKGNTNFESKSLGSIDSETVKSLAGAFKEGIKLLSEIIKNSPDLLKKFDEDLTKEAEKRVEAKLEEEKKKIEEDSKESKLEKTKEDGQISPAEKQQEPIANNTEGINTEKSKMQ